MLHSLVYISSASAPVTDDLITDLVAGARVKNQRLGITGRLVCKPNAFAQLIEGPRQATQQLFRRIKEDPRHHEVICIVDRPIADRSFRDWAFLLPTDAAASTSLGQSSPTSTDMEEQLLERGVEKVLASPGGKFLLEAFRVRPQQDRAMQTVDALFRAAESVILEQGAGALSLDRAAQEAQITPQAAYRYFESTENLIQAVIRRRQVIAADWVIAALKTATFADTHAMAAWIIDTLLARLMNTGGIHGPTFRFLYRNHHRIFHEGTWLVGDALRAAMRRNNLPCAAVTDAQLAIALSGLLGAAKTIALRDSALLAEPVVRASLTEGFLGALRAGPQAP